jgi:hypothetical protein
MGTKATPRPDDVLIGCMFVPRAEWDEYAEWLRIEKNRVLCDLVTRADYEAQRRSKDEEDRLAATPQAAQVLSERDMLDCLREFTHEVPTRLPMGWSMAFRAAEKRILSKLQAAPQARDEQGAGDRGHYFEFERGEWTKDGDKPTKFLQASGVSYVGTLTAKQRDDLDALINGFLDNRDAPQASQGVGEVVPDDVLSVALQPDPFWGKRKFTVTLEAPTEDAELIEAAQQSAPDGYWLQNLEAIGGDPHIRTIYKKAAPLQTTQQLPTLPEPVGAFGHPTLKSWSPEELAWIAERDLKWRAALEAQKAETVPVHEVTRMLNALISAEAFPPDMLELLRTILQPQAQKAAAPELVGPEVSLNIIRFWPDGFANRLEQVWLDLVGFIPNYKLHDMQKVMAEFGFTMKVYETGLPTGTASDGGEG